MARPPKEISQGAREAWARGDEAGAEKASGLGWRQLRNRLGPPGRGGAASPEAAKAPEGPGPAKGKAPPSRPAAGLPQGGAATAPRPDLLELLRRIGRARNAAAWAEVEEGLLVYTRGGEEALGPWLARPIEAVEIDEDELATLREGLGVAVAVSRTAEAGGPQLRALTIVERLGKSIATVKARRPPEEKPDAADERVRSRMASCVERLTKHTRERAEKLKRDRAALLDGLDVGPATAAEIGRRVDAMMGGAG